MRAIILAGLLLFLNACDDDPSGPGFVVEPAELGGDAYTPPLRSETSGVRISVEVMTYGGGSTAFHHTDVSVDTAERIIMIRPYNIEIVGLRTDILREIVHTVTLEPGPGEWLVRAIGRGGHGVEMHARLPSGTSSASR